MNENRDYEYREHDDSCFVCKHPIMKHICIALLTFLGAFMAFYVVTDWHYKRMLDPAVQMRKMDKMMRSDARYMDKLASKETFKEMQPTRRDDSFIRLEKTDKNYKVIVDLRPFDNDEKNVEVLANGNVLTINAAGSSKKHWHEKILKISQNYMFDDDINLNNITKIREGKDLVIYIPTDN